MSLSKLSLSLSGQKQIQQMFLTVSYDLEDFNWRQFVISNFVKIAIVILALKEFSLAQIKAKHYRLDKIIQL